MPDVLRQPNDLIFRGKNVNDLSQRCGAIPQKNGELNTLRHVYN
jgi:hypothetical protein